MAHTRLTNPGLEPVVLPYPLDGNLMPGESRTATLTRAAVQAILGSDLTAYLNATEVSAAENAVGTADLSDGVIGSHLLPGTGNSYDLGARTTAFRSGYFDTAVETPLIRDTNGNEAIVVGATASAVNHLGVTNAATGNAVALSALGDDAAVSLDVAPKGTGTGSLRSGAGTARIQWDNTGLGFFGAAAAAQPAAEVDVAAQDVGGTPDQTSINTAVNAVGTTLNNLLGKLRTLGLIAT